MRTRTFDTIEARWSLEAQILSRRRYLELRLFQALTKSGLYFSAQVSHILNQQRCILPQIKV